MKIPEIENVYIIIPSLNPDEKLSKTVESIKNAGFSHIIVVDDGSDFGHKGFFPDEDEVVKKIVESFEYHGVVEYPPVTEETEK